MKKSKPNSNFPTEILVYLLRIRATMSVPPVVPPALKIIPNPTPKSTPETKATITKSPSRLN